MDMDDGITDDSIAPAAPVELPMSFDAFASTLRPQPVRDAAGRAVGLMPGHADEIWIKLIRKLHGSEKNTLTGWNALIGKQRDQPAHPAGMAG